jgi:hypothetical protein
METLIDLEKLKARHWGRQKVMQRHLG